MKEEQEILNNPEEYPELYRVLKKKLDHAEKVKARQKVEAV